MTTQRAMPISIVTNPSLRYPESGDAFSPSEAYPEYSLGHVSSGENPVYEQVRALLAGYGLDGARFGTPNWNPLRELIPEGSRVFVLCNFVYHRRPRESFETFHSKCIHGSVLRALVDYVLLATGSSGSVSFGNSALQSCRFDRVLAETGSDRVESFYRERNLPVRSRDLRLHIAPQNALGRVVSVTQGDDRYAVEFDLGADSLLAELQSRSVDRGRFRVADYDPRRIEAFHAGGHRYVIHRDVLDSDVVISLSKLKTHEKVGITCGLKGFVGTVGHKDCLAHHRFGNPAAGGDEYPDSLGFLKPVSRFHDWVNEREQEASLQPAAQIVDRTIRRALRRCGALGGGAWDGNDTAWRMTLDLARIVHYGTADGEMRSQLQRRHLSLIDGVIAGEGNGPLDPSPVSAGTLVFGDDVALVDRIACRLMGFEPARIPLVREAFRREPWPITLAGDSESAECVLNGQATPESDLLPVLSRTFRPPAGWRSLAGSS